MLKITEEKDQITVREIPVGLWIGSLIATNFLFFLIYIQFSSEMELASKILWISALILCIIGGICFILMNPAATIKINRQSKSFSIRKHSLLKNSSDVYAFDEIADLVYVSEINNSKDIIYQIKLPLKDGRKINVTRSIGSKEGQFFKVVDSINAYIFDSPNQIPFKLTIFHED